MTSRFDRKPVHKSTIATLLGAVVATNAHAQAGGAAPADLQNIADKILGVLQGQIVSTVLTIALIGLGIGLVMNKDNDQMKKRFIVWIIAVAVIKGATSILSWVWG